MQTVAERIREALVTERVLATLAGLLAAAAAALACAGLYGLFALSVSRQTREIGVRLALGADRRSVVLRVLSQSIVLALIGIAAGLGTTLALGHFVRGFLFQVAARRSGVDRCCSRPHVRSDLPGRPGPRVARVTGRPGYCVEGCVTRRRESAGVKTRPSTRSAGSEPPPSTISKSPIRGWKGLSPLGRGATFQSR